MALTDKATRGYVDTAVAQLTQQLIDGKIQIPQVFPASLNFAGGTNHAPNSDINYSKDAATVPGTLPGDPGDGNQEAFRFYRQLQGADITVDAAHALKAVDHSLYAANEGADTSIPIWNRVIGYPEFGGAAGNDQYDLAIQLRAKVVGPGQRWYLRVVMAALDATLIPVLRLYAGLWVINGVTQEWAKGDPFDLTYTIHGTPGTTSTNYRVWALIDSGVSILSNILNVPDAPDLLSLDDYVTLFFNAGAGFIEFRIYREIAGVFTFVYTIKNSNELHYHDIGDVGVSRPATDWPVVVGATPLAYNEKKPTVIAAYGQTWIETLLMIDIPHTYASSATDADGQFLRLGLTGPTGVDRHVGIDHIWWSMSNNQWAPDPPIVYTDGTEAIPSVSPDTGAQGGGGGVEDPGTCITRRLPVRVEVDGQPQYVPFRATRMTSLILGQHKTPYLPVRKLRGRSAGYYAIATANGTYYECNALHELMLSVRNDESIQAQHVRVGTVLEGEVGRRRVRTKVKSIAFVPIPVDVGTWYLRHPEGKSKPGKGIYVAGKSKKMDRGLYSRNLKHNPDDFGVV